MKCQSFRYFRCEYRGFVKIINCRKNCTRSVPKLFDLHSSRCVGVIFHHSTGGIFQSSPRFILQPASVFLLPKAVLELSSRNGIEYTRRVTFKCSNFPLLSNWCLWSDLDSTEVDEAILHCVLFKIAPVYERTKEARHRLANKVAVISELHHAIYSEIQQNILYWLCGLWENTCDAQLFFNRKKQSTSTWHCSNFDVLFWPWLGLKVTTLFESRNHESMIYHQK